MMDVNKWVCYGYWQGLSLLPQIHHFVNKSLFLLPLYYGQVIVTLERHVAFAIWWVLYLWYSLLPSALHPRCPPHAMVGGRDSVGAYLHCTSLQPRDLITLQDRSQEVRALYVKLLLMCAIAVSENVKEGDEEAYRRQRVNLQLWLDARSFGNCPNQFAADWTSAAAAKIILVKI